MSQTQKEKNVLYMWNCFKSVKEKKNILKVENEDGAKKFRGG